MYRSKGKHAYVSETCNSLDDIGALVHDNDGTRTKARLGILQGIVVHTIRGRELGYGT